MLLLLEKGADIATKDTYQQTALHLAAREGHEAVVRLLIEKGAEVAAKDVKNKWTALHWAAGGGHEAVVRLLQSTTTLMFDNF
jgi:serine/threonine-protein phosphatase 6 regulatory ankyrin repeat subunit A